MTTVNRGIKYEYKIKKELEHQGYYVIRSAGSHGIYDLVGIHWERQEVVLVQCKYGSEKYISSTKPFKAMLSTGWTLKTAWYSQAIES